MIPPDGWVQALGLLPLDAELPEPFEGSYATGPDIGALRPLPDELIVVRSHGAEASYALGQHGDVLVSLIQRHVFAALLVDRLEPPPLWDPCGDAGGSFEPCAVPTGGSWVEC